MIKSIRQTDIRILFWKFLKQETKKKKQKKKTFNSKKFGEGTKATKTLQEL